MAAKVTYVALYYGNLYSEWMRDFLKDRFILLLGLALLFAGILFYLQFFIQPQQSVKPGKMRNEYWFMLYRQSQKEELYQGTPGSKSQSILIKTFQVKTGRPGERPTPLPQLAGRKYWLLTEKREEKENPETAPYFLTLDVPGIEEAPFGPVPYTECGGEQCDWILPGAFGLHGTAGHPEKLSEDDPGSSGCIRHRDEDITYLYNLLDPENNEIRYYIEDK